MTGLRNLLLHKGPKALVLLLAALAMHALVPVGHMVAAAPGHGLVVTMCPVTHPLARAAMDAEAQMPEMGGMDHAAMGHAPADDGTPVTAQGKSDCAFSALGTAAVDPGGASFEIPLRSGAEADLPPLPEFALAEADRLRPPLRAPPRFR